MQALNLVSTCRHCRYYQLEGRRGGHCQELDVFVEGRWKACQLAISPFTPSWKLEEMQTWQLEAVKLSEQHSSTNQSPLCTNSCIASSLTNNRFRGSDPSRLIASSSTSLSAIDRPNHKNFPLAPTA